MLISAEAELRSPVPAITLRRTDIPDAPSVTYSFVGPSHPDFKDGATERANSFAWAMAGEQGDDHHAFLRLLADLRRTHDATLLSGSELDFVMSLIA
jgi:hypothetical protein